MKYLFYLIIFFFGEQSAYSQTCCSGGVPLSSNLGLPVGEKGVLQLALTYDLNILETLKTGRETLEDNARSRRTHSTIFEIGYTWSDKFSVDGFFSFVRQERIINQFGSRNFSATSGIGDAVLLLKYKLWSTKDNGTVLQVGVGPKIPLGASDKRSSSGLTFNADLQPGSGAWDAVTFLQFTKVLNKRPSMSLLATATYGLKGKNKEYFGVQTYQFGNEFQLAVGLSDRLLIGKHIIDPSLLMQFRNQTPDIIDAEDLPSTGGNWVFVNPSLAYWATPDFSINLGVALPVFASITGTQVTPTVRFTTGVFYRLFTPKKELTNF